MYKGSVCVSKKEFKPKRQAAKTYRNHEDFNYCQEHETRISDLALKRPKKGEPKILSTAGDECERVEVERRFSIVKRKCGIGLVIAKLRETALT